MNISDETSNTHSAPEDANLPVTMTLAEHYEGVRQAQEAAWEQGRNSIAADFLKPAGENGMRPTSPNPYTGQS